MARGGTDETSTPGEPERRPSADASPPPAKRPPLRRARSITLVLLAGTAITLGGCESEEAKCRRARAEGWANAEAVCASAGRSGSSTSSSYISSGSGSRDGGSSTTTSTRGGFGSTASAHGSSGG